MPSKERWDFLEVPTKGRRNKEKVEEALGLNNLAAHARFCDLHFLSQDDLMPIEENGGSYWQIDGASSNKRRLSKRHVQNEKKMQRDELTLLKIRNAKLEKIIQKQNTRIMKLRRNLRRQKNVAQILKNQTKKSKYFDIQNYAEDDDAIFHWTGLQNFDQLKDLAENVSNVLKVKKISRNMSNENAVALVLIRLRRGFKYRTMGYLFKLKFRNIQTIVNRLLPVLVQICKPAIRNLTDEEVKKWTDPSVFEHIPEAQTLIMDCTYIYTEHPNNLSLQQDTFSGHKFRNLAKFLIVCYPNGQIAGAFGPFGADDDDWITKELLHNDPTFLALLRKAKVIIVDRGFKLKELFGERNIRILQPSFLHGRKQFPAEEVVGSRVVASARTVIETCNARIKQFRLLHYLYSTKELGKLKDWVTLAVSLVNLNYKLLRGPPAKFGLLDYDSDSDDDEDYFPTDENSEDLESDSDEDTDLEIEKEELKELKKKRYEKHPSPLKFDSKYVDFPETLKWKKTEDVSSFPTLSLPLIRDFFKIPSTSSNPKSMVERGLLYLLPPYPKVKCVWKVVHKDQEYLRINCEGSFTSSLHHAYAWEKDGNLFSYCDCKNGMSKCAHQAALYIKILSMQFEISPEELLDKHGFATIMILWIAYPKKGIRITWGKKN